MSVGRLLVLVTGLVLSAALPVLLFAQIAQELMPKNRGSHGRRGGGKAMIKFISLCCVPMLALIIAAVLAWSAEQRDDCEARMRTLEASPAEGADRLAEKNAVIDYCDRQYKRDKTVGRLVRECAKYEEQPIIKQQFVAECMLAAYGYANALSSLKAEFGK